MPPLIKFEATFFLRGVDPCQVVQTYLEGGYRSLSLAQIQKTAIKPANHRLTLATRYGETPDDETYVYRDKTNTQRVVLTTGHDLYTKAKAEPGVLPVHGFCNWCRQAIRSPPVGIPIKLQWNRQTGQTVYHVIDSYCRFECCYAGLKRDGYGNYLTRDPLYLNSEYLLRMLFNEFYPDRQLQPALDWRLLKSNGGPLDEKSYYETNHGYQRTSNVVLLPVKVEYIRV